MEQYEYKVDAIQATVTDADISKGVAGSVVAGQVELKLKELSKQGFEFYREFPVTVKVKEGCFGSVQKLFGQGGSKDPTFTIIVMVFRRPVV